MSISDVRVKETFPPRRKPKQVQQHIDSMTRVYPERTHGLGLWGNPRVPMTIRVDSGLKSAFKEVAKLKFGSTCNPIESVMAAIVGCYEQPTIDGVYPSITIGEIKIERNLRERRKEVVVDKEVTETVYSRMDKNLQSIKVACKTVVNARVCQECGLDVGVYPRIDSEGKKVLLCGNCAKAWFKMGKIPLGRTR